MFEEFCGQKAQIDIVAGCVNDLLVITDADGEVVALKKCMRYCTIEIEIERDHHLDLHLE